MRETLLILRLLTVPFLRLVPVPLAAIPANGPPPSGREINGAQESSLDLYHQDCLGLLRLTED